MLDIIKQKLNEAVNKEETKGLFFSLFDQNNSLLCSNGVIQTDKKINDLTDIIYHGILEKFPQTKKIAIDIILETKTETDIIKLLGYNPQERGIVLENKQANQNGIILPNTQGVVDMKTALGLIKQKNTMTGNVEITLFKTKRISFEV
jgi:hypothetical protein